MTGKSPLEVDHDVVGDAAMEPGRDDREERSVVEAVEAAAGAAMEPGRDDREEHAAPRQSPASHHRRNEWSPVEMTGKSGGWREVKSTTVMQPQWSPVEMTGKSTPTPTPGGQHGERRNGARSR